MIKIQMTNVSSVLQINMEIILNALIVEKTANNVKVVIYLIASNARKII